NLLKTPKVPCVRIVWVGHSCPRFPVTVFFCSWGAGTLARVFLSVWVRTSLSKISCDCVLLLVWRGHSCPRLFVRVGRTSLSKISCDLCSFARVARALLPASFCPCGSDIPVQDFLW